MTPEFVKCSVCCTPKLCAARGCVPPVFDDEEYPIPQLAQNPSAKGIFDYRFAFYDSYDVEQARLEGSQALTDLRIRDTWLKIRSEQIGVPLVVAKKDPHNLGARSRVGDWSIVDQDVFAQIPVDELLAQIKAHRADQQATRAAARSTETAKKREAKNALIWHRPEKLTERFVLVGEEVHEVRYRDPVTEEGIRLERVFETSPYPVRSNTVQHKGKTFTVSMMRRILSHGQIGPRPGGRRPGKPRYRAQIRLGQQVKHLGMFDTAEDRDAAVMAARVNHLLGLTP